MHNLFTASAGRTTGGKASAPNVFKALGPGLEICSPPGSAVGRRGE